MQSNDSDWDQRVQFVKKTVSTTVVNRQSHASAMVEKGTLDLTPVVLYMNKSDENVQKPVILRK